MTLHFEGKQKGRFGKEYYWQGCLGMPIILPCGTYARCIEIKTDKCIQKQRCDCFVFVCGFAGGWLRHPKFARVGPQPRSLLCSQSSVEGTGKSKCALGTQRGNGKWEFARMILPTDAPQMTEMWMNRSMILYCILTVVYSYNQVFSVRFVVWSWHIPELPTLGLCTAGYTAKEILDLGS